MVKRIVWSANALADRIEILDYWNKRIGSKIYSNKLDKSLKDVIHNLSIFPEIGRKMEYSEERFIVKDNYEIFYLIDENVVQILHIWDSRRDPISIKLYE